MKWIKDYDFHFLNSDKLDSSGQYTKEFQGRLYPEHIKFIKDLLDKQKQEERDRIKQDMISKMHNWHGTGLAMINDYFKKLTNT